MTEHGFTVRPRSTRDIARVAEDFLTRLAPVHLRSGGALDLIHLIDHGLQQEQIMVYPVEADDLPDAEAETRAGDGEWIEIWMREEFFDALFEENSSTNRARSTLGHEIGHAVLHQAELRTGRSRPQALALRRAPRSEIEPFRDSEWQAHTFAGALLMPRPVLRSLDLGDSYGLGERFKVSEAFVRSHLARIRRVL